MSRKAFCLFFNIYWTLKLGVNYSFESSHSFCGICTIISNLPKEETKKEI